MENGHIERFRSSLENESMSLQVPTEGNATDTRLGELLPHDGWDCAHFLFQRDRHRRRASFTRLRAISKEHWKNTRS